MVSFSKIENNSMKQRLFLPFFLAIADFSCCTPPIKVKFFDENSLPKSVKTKNKLTDYKQLKS